MRLSSILRVIDRGILSQHVVNVIISAIPVINLFLIIVNCLMYLGPFMWLWGCWPGCKFYPCYWASLSDVFVETLVITPLLSNRIIRRHCYDPGEFGVIVVRPLLVPPVLLNRGNCPQFWWTVVPPSIFELVIFASFVEPLCFCHCLLWSIFVVTRRGTITVTWHQYLVFL